MGPEERVRAGFRAVHGVAPDLVVQAPGRVNLIGEHTDYNDGFVLPCAIDFRTAIAARRRDDGTIRATALDFGGAEDAFALGAAVPHAAAGGWSDYVRGAAEILRRRGFALGGADLVIAGDVPQGAGLSSSASLLVAVIETLRRLDGLAGLSAPDVAVAAREAENDYVGVQCGIMDQLISACGEDGHALMIDCRSLALTPVAIHPDLAVLIVHSGIERGLVGSEYNRRRQECERAAAFFGVPALRDVTVERLDAAEGTLDGDAFRRARHIVSENARVAGAAVALEAGDTPALKRLMAASHTSMRDDFAITTPAIDGLVGLIDAAVGEDGGARMTGGGFGGCVVSVLRRERLDAAREAVARDYRTPGGEAARVFVCRASAGAGAV